MWVCIFVCVCGQVCRMFHHLVDVQCVWHTLNSYRSNPDILRSTLEGHDVIKGEGGAWAEYLRLHADPGSQVSELCYSGEISEQALVLGVPNIFIRRLKLIITIQQCNIDWWAHSFVSVNVFGVHRYPLLSDRLSVWLMTSQVTSQKETRKLSTVTKRLQVFFFISYSVLFIISYLQLADLDVQDLVLRVSVVLL